MRDQRTPKDVCGEANSSPLLDLLTHAGGLGCVTICYMQSMPNCRGRCINHFVPTSYLALAQAPKVFGEREGDWGE